MSIEEIRSAVSALPRASNGRIHRVPKTLRSEIVALARTSGEPSYRFAASIGVSGSILALWSRGARGGRPGKLKSIRIVADAAPQEARWCLEGPSGLRVSGMTICELAELFRKLEER